MNARTTSFAIAALVIVSGAVAQDKAVLRFQPAVGSKLSVTTVSELKMAFSGMMDQESNSKSTVDQVFTFEAAQDGKTKFQLNTTALKIEGESMAEMAGGGNVDGIKNAVLTGYFDSRGATSDVQVSGLAEDDMMGNMILTMAKELYKQIGFFGFQFPEQEVGVGSKWDSQLDFSELLSSQSMGFLTNAKGAVPVTMEVVAFEPVEGVPCVKIKSLMDGKVTFDVNAPGMETSGNMTVTSLTHAWFNLATGMLVKSEAESANVIDMGMMTINQTTKTVSSAKAG
jgi:hypothetical protein